MIIKCVLTELNSTKLSFSESWPTSVGCSPAWLTSHSHALAHTRQNTTGHYIAFHTHTIFNRDLMGEDWKLNGWMWPAAKSSQKLAAWVRTVLCLSFPSLCRELLVQSVCLSATFCVLIWSDLRVTPATSYPAQWHKGKCHGTLNINDPPTEVRLGHAQI